MTFLSDGLFAINMSKSPLVYLDHNATTPVHPDVLQAMLPVFTDHFGNPDSRSHAFGWQAKALVDVARESILKELKAANQARLVFTSSATEANNLALKGVVAATTQDKAHIITQITEHACILETCRWLEKQGHHVTYLKVNSVGLVDEEELKNALTPQTRLVSIMLANNEIGTLQNVKELAQITRAHSSAFFHTDAVQALGKMPVNVADLDVDLLSLSAHKMYGTKGVGALYLSPKIKNSQLAPQMQGGGHEEGLRSGTLNVPAIVGFAKALELANINLSTEVPRLQKLQTTLIEELYTLEGVSLNGPKTNRLCNNLNFWIKNVKAENLILAMPQFAFSTGSACASGKAEPSYVVQAIGRSREEALCSVRLGLGLSTTQAHVESFIQAFRQAILG